MSRSRRFLLLLWILPLCAADRYQASEPHMGTLVTITLYADSPDQAQRGFAAAFGRIAKLDYILSDYKPDSELSRVCEADTPPSPELLEVLVYAQRLAVQTDGAFDITVGSLSRLWREARAKKRLPSPAAIVAALSRSGYRNLRIEKGQVRCLVPGMQLDAGGLGKGYAGDQAIAALRSEGIMSSLVAISGDIVAGDPPPGAKGWKVRVQSEIVKLANAAVSTSGDEFQYLDVGGVRYSHVFDPRTGMALRESRPVSVIARTGLEADSLDTAIAVLGPGWAKYIVPNMVLRVIEH